MSNHLCTLTIPSDSSEGRALSKLARSLGQDFDLGGHASDGHGMLTVDVSFAADSLEDIALAAATAEAKAASETIKAARAKLKLLEDAADAAADAATAAKAAADAAKAAAAATPE